MTRTELDDRLTFSVVPDILSCMNEPSAHNKSGKYKFKCEDQTLTLNFEWKKTSMTIEEIHALKDGTRVILTQLGEEWEEDQGESGVCVKVGNRLLEADIERPNDSNEWYIYYTIDELNDKGWECEVVLE